MPFDSVRLHPDLLQVELPFVRKSLGESGEYILQDVD